jgi:hypothetical protein
MYGDNRALSDLDEKVNLFSGLEGIRTKPIVAYLKSDIRLE